MGRSVLLCRRRGLLVAAVASCACALAAPVAQADRGFSARYATTDRGLVTFVANTLETCPDAAATCAAARNGTGPTPTDNSFAMRWVDVDSDATTFDSSRANLALPAGATVLWAGLYWAGDTSAGVGGASAPSPGARNQVRFSVPGAGYATVTATTLDTDATAATRYQGVADVTLQVAAAGNGAYAIANVQSGTGADRWAGWSLAVVYRDPSQPTRRLQVYDGFADLQAGGSTSDTINLGNFLTPATGTVGARLGIVAWEGDRGITGESATLATRTLSDAANPANDIFNSTIARNGANVTSKTPNYVNQMGVDADELQVDGAIGNGVSSTTLRLTTTTDRYLIGAIALATDEGLPVNRTPPTITGTARDGRTLTADRGTWDGTPTLTYAYQWRRCSAAGTSCTDVPGATSATYNLTPADVGATMRVFVTATNAAGSASATSAQTATVTAAQPVNTSPPTISGTARDASTLTLDRGTWTGTPTIDYAYQWRRCDVSGAACVDIPGATTTSYTLTPADVGATIRATVTATNTAGAATATAAQTAVVTAVAPASTSPPTISGTAREGSTLTLDRGTWTGTPPTSFAYQWRRCDASGAACVDIPGATGTTYTLTPSDVGATVRANVTATNAAGSSSATSAATAGVAASPPVNTSPPTISGTPRDGSSLTVDRGAWTGTPSLTYAYQWRRCDASGAACTDISGATSAAYNLTPADVGATVRATVTATNAAGASSATTAATAGVAAVPPASTSPPSVGGTPAQGSVLSADHGSWTGSPPLAYAYQWQRCAADGSACADIAGATAATYALGVADVGDLVRVVVTATNAGGHASATSTATAAVTAAPAPPQPTSPTAPSSGSSSATPTPVTALETDLSTLPGSLVAARACALLTSGAGLRHLQVAGVGIVRLRVRAEAVVAPDAPVRVSLTARAGKRLRAALTLDGRRLRATGRNPVQATVPLSAVRGVGAHALQARVTPRRGRVQTLTVGLRFAACATRLTAHQGKTERGTSLRLRVDSRAPVAAAAFTVPARVALRGAAKRRVVGRLRLVAAGGASRTLKLTLPAHVRSGTLLAVRGTAQVTFSTRGFQVTGLAPGAGIVELTLAELRAAATGKPIRVRASVTTGAGRATLTVTARGARR